jgi:kumamolisin
MNRTLLLTLALGTTSLGSAVAASAPQDRVPFRDSLVAVAADAPATRAHVVRRVLTAAERAAPVDVVVSLRMRDFAGLQGRIQAGERIARAEMEARYLPLAGDYARVASWLTAQGFTVTQADSSHTNVFARGSVDQASAALGVSFARVATRDGEFSSAVTAPSLPASLAGVVLSIDGLQPHILMHHSPFMRRDAVTEVSAHITPADVDAAYNMPATLDGTGQGIAIIMGATPLTSDLTAFWQAVGQSTTLANYTTVNIGSGPSTSSQSDNDDEATLDVEWASGMAPGAKVTLYAVPSLTTSSFLEACSQILSDGTSKVVSYSADGPEDQLPNSQLSANSQTIAQLAAAGITVMASSGDGGSNPNPESDPSNGYSPSNELIVSYPASDPNITAVGGTTIGVNSSWAAISEVTWSEIGSVTTNPLASGGGVSSFFTRPSWQAGTGVPPGSNRCIPDVAAFASVDPPSGNTGAVVVLNGQVTGLIGTSLSSPVWAGMAAVINQARANAGLSSIGLLNRYVYALIGSSAFNDITSGSNGAYQAGVGYDLCTGVGSPNVSNLIAQMDTEITESPAPSSPVKSGTPISLSAVSQVTPATYQWSLNGVAIAAATSSTYSIPFAGAADNGAYTVVVTSSSGALTYDLGTLTTTSDARIINLSARADVQTGGNLLIAGFAVSGSGQKTVLLRGVGPGLAQFGVSGELLAPVLTLLNSGGTAITSNSKWGGGATLTSEMSAVGAFSLPSSSLDAVLDLPVAAGQYTAQVSGANSTSGIALAEVYDADAGTPATRLFNISARADVQSGSNALIAGFVIEPGPTGADETLLIRGVGPRLAVFGISGTLQNPVLTLFDSSQKVIGTNQGWSTASVAGNSSVNAGIEPATSTVMANVGAFSLVAGAADDAMIVTLPPGSYTAQVSSGGTASGIGLVEVYEVK